MSLSQKNVIQLSITSAKNSATSALQALTTAQAYLDLADDADEDSDLQNARLDTMRTQLGVADQHFSSGGGQARQAQTNADIATE